MQRRYLTNNEKRERSEFGRNLGVPIIPNNLNRIL